MVFLDDDFVIREPAHGLSAMLLRGTQQQHLDGTDFLSLLASAEDQDKAQ